MRTPRSVRFIERVDEGVTAIARRTGRDLSAVINELLDEGLKMRRFPGIAFVDHLSGRKAHLAGTGLAVYQIARGFHDVDHDWERLREGYHWLSDGQLRLALAYAEAYPDEIEEHIQADEWWTPERTYETYPFMRPGPPR